MEDRHEVRRDQWSRTRQTGDSRTLAQRSRYLDTPPGDKKVLCRRLIVVACLAGMLSACGCVTREVDFVPKVTELPREAVCIPIVLEDGLPFVEATINGCGPYRFLFDTGAPPLAVSDKVARELDLPVTLMRSTGTDPDGVVSAPRPVVVVDTLGLGGATFRELLACVNRVEHLDPGCDGVLGLRPLKNCLVTIDFPGRQLRLERGRLVDPETPVDRLGVPRTDFAKGLPRVPVFVVPNTSDPVIFDMTVDTGFNGGLALPAEAKAHQFPWVEVGEVTSVMAEGRRVQRRYGELDAKVLVGGLIFEKPIVAYVEGRHGAIGMQALRCFVLTFDQAHGLTRFVPAKPPKP